MLKYFRKLHYIKFLVIFINLLWCYVPLINLPFEKTSRKTIFLINHDTVLQSFLFIAFSPTQPFLQPISRDSFEQFCFLVASFDVQVLHDCPLAMTRVTRVRPRKDLSSRSRGQRSWPGLLSEYCSDVKFPASSTNITIQRLTHFCSTSSELDLIFAY